jgi:hypothetical protein
MVTARDVQAGAAEQARRDLCLSACGTGWYLQDLPTKAAVSSPPARCNPLIWRPDAPNSSPVKTALVLVTISFGCLVWAAYLQNLTMEVFFAGEPALRPRLSFLYQQGQFAIYGAFISGTGGAILGVLSHLKRAQASQGNETFLSGIQNPL